MVSLKKFVAATLTEIVEGVLEAQKCGPIIESSAAIAPTGQGIKDEITLNQVVDFEVAITAEEQTETKGGIGIIIGAITLGSSGKSGSSEQAHNKVRFSVPIHLPGQKIKH